MEFRILSHAAMWVRCGGTSVVIDPWLVGSCYWRSWWNFPRAVFDEREMAVVDAVILSHQHWDHWHGPSLRKLFAGKPVLIPDEPALRSGRDLRTIGFRDVRRIPHGKTVEIGALRITLYQFGRYVNDSAIVVEGDGVTLLNANDAKIAGWPLRHLVARHGPIDFAFRSHSSANARVCWRLEGDTAYVVDDHEHYMRSFVQFMDAVQPRYAVPFASNHCHLHDDVFGYNEMIATPLELREHVRSLPPRRWALQVMLPGSHWQEGAAGQPDSFDLAPETPYEDMPATLRTYRAEQAPALERFRQQENAVVVSDALLERFLDFFRASRARPPAPLGVLKLVLRWPDGRRQAHVIDLDRATVASAPDAARCRARTADARDAGDRLPRRRRQEHVRPRRHLQALRLRREQPRRPASARRDRHPSRPARARALPRLLALSHAPRSGLRAALARDGRLRPGSVAAEGAQAPDLAGGRGDPEAQRSEVADRKVVPLLPASTPGD